MSKLPEMLSGKNVNVFTTNYDFRKKLIALLWGIENNDPKGIPTAIRNCKGLQPEDSLWLYSMTNASNGKINDKRGWRMALRYALCENPIYESNQISLFNLK